ncbi:MAG: carboxypeptidase-like regulatory domain-containing protein, partial [Gemmataceae bacterium]|nr:carboxypeptidase-like regulatory domain-containing protein [Gemmataceae bacterium]
MRAPYSFRGLFDRPVRLVGRILLLLAVVGCSRATPVLVTVEVTLDGRPVEGATVTFHPLKDDNHDGSSPQGKTDKLGAFHLAGARPGEYKVVIIKSVLADPKLKMPNFPDTPEGRNQKEDWLWRHFGDDRPPYKNLLPDKYG